MIDFIELQKGKGIVLNRVSLLNLNANYDVAFGATREKRRTRRMPAAVYTHRAKYARCPIGNVYGVQINKSDALKNVKQNPTQELFNKASGGAKPKFDTWTQERLYYGSHRPDKKWVGGVNASELLKRDLDEAINSTLTLVYGKDIPKQIPSDIKTPDFGNNWGRHANYIEINNRALGEMHDNRTNSGILGAIKLLPAIPPSHDKWANCILVSQLYPNIWGDGWNNNGENSLYGIKLEFERASDNIGWVKVGDKTFTPEEQIKAFNDLAHLRGLKTSYRMLISEDQIKIGDSGQFRWSNPEHVEAFIAACCKGIELGFDGIFFDSAKHVGGYDWGHYAGVGAVPEYDQMAYILNEIRVRTGRQDLSFSGEKTENDSMRYKNMGFSAGTSGVNARSVDDVKYSARKQAWCDEFAWGPTVSDDNDVGAIGYDERLDRINGSLFGYSTSREKLPSFMQMHDLFPLNYDTNTHELMMENISFSTDGKPMSHWENLFADNQAEKDYRRAVGERFAYAYGYNPA